MDHKFTINEALDPNSKQFQVHSKKVIYLPVHLTQDVAAFSNKPFWLDCFHAVGKHNFKI